MDKASDFGSEDCEFESRRGRDFVIFSLDYGKSYSNLTQNGNV
jgi:hypothetical protein